MTSTIIIFLKFTCHLLKKTKKRKLRIISNYDEASRQEKSPSKPEQSQVTTIATNEEAVRESGDALDIYERLSHFLPDPRDKTVSKKREWSSGSFSGSVKEVKRVTREKNTKII
ncbi:hypothetical protein TNIN_471651 [Trichonephila inaurata madagascariensis]|uniref:Uncharacterized protein n=1 Tax=Trichonephila inaurata madagascariensis TaxID=2747483 RepID=A0A8X6X374_9ARAC|nr:hypothetical protein TNIN_471651 [Trichonephila inaurata madagascariensis]